MSTWGLVNWKSVTVPFTVTDLAVSYAAAPWCANAAPAIARVRRATIKVVTSLTLIEFLQSRTGNFVSATATEKMHFASLRRHLPTPTPFVHCELTEKSALGVCDRSLHDQNRLRNCFLNTACGRIESNPRKHFSAHPI